MRLTIPKLRTWHLLGIVAASAGLISVMQFRWSVEDPGWDLVRRLRSLDGAERAKAAAGLGGFRPRERRAIAPLTELLFDPDARARAMAARALSAVVDMKDEAEVGQLKAALASALGDRDPVARRAIAVELSHLQPEPKVVVPTLLGFARDGDAEARAEVIGCLGPYLRRDEAARVAVFAALEDPDLMVRWRAVHALEWGAHVPDLAPPPLLGATTAALVGAADDESPIVRSAAVYTLGRIRNSARVEIPRVIEALGDPDAEVRFQAANILRWGRPETLLSAFRRALADRDTRVRRASATGLGRLGPDAEPDLPALRSLAASDPDRDVRVDALSAVNAIEAAIRASQASFAKAIAELDDADPDVRALAADWLAGAGPKAVDAVPSLVRRLADPEADVRRAAADALGRIGPGAAVAVPALAKLAESDPDERVRRVATSSRSALIHPDAGKDRDP